MAQCPEACSIQVFDDVRLGGRQTGRTKSFFGIPGLTVSMMTTSLALAGQKIRIVILLVVVHNYFIVVIMCRMFLTRFYIKCHCMSA